MKGRLAVVVWMTPVLMFFATSTRAQETRVPADLQYALLTKIMTFDRSFASRSGTEIVIGIVYEKRWEESRDAAEEITRTIAHSAIKAINGVPVRVVQIDVESAASMLVALHDKSVDIAYIMPLKENDAAEILSALRRTHTTSFTGVPEYVALGVCAGIGIKRSLPEIIINLTAAKAAGQDFSSQLLKLSRVVV